MTSFEIAGFAHQAKTPRAAAVAGIVFALLFSTGVAAIRLAVPNELSVVRAWSESTRSQLSWAMISMPFAGIAFLWFTGVIRDKLGDFEDRFFSTVTLGSGLLFLAMSFAAFAIAAGMLAQYRVGQGEIITIDFYLINQSIISQLFNTYALKMAGVFMFSLATLWRKTSVMPRSLSLATYLLALIVIVSLSHNLWLALIFPAWVLVISVFNLYSGLKREPAEIIDGIPAQPVG